MNYIFWNSRGTGAKAFPSLVRELTKKQNLDFLAILETRCGGEKARKIATSLGFDNFKVVDAQGYSGGLWVLWKNNNWKFEVLGTHDQFIYVTLDMENTIFFITAFYGSPNPVKCRVLWAALRDLSSLILGPWCIGGDFNSTLYMHDCRSSRGIGSCIDRDMSKGFEDMELSDLGCQGRLNRLGNFLILLLKWIG
ncbi:hypothetical protein K1719_027958 [Acacia pycnantha]|nr:hypothetical protein K1719_027958 [Acacia pycnantha]